MTLTEEARVTHKCGSMTATEAPVLTAWTSLVQNAEAQLYLQDESLLKSYVLDDTCILSYYLIDPSTRLLHVCNCLVFCRSKESWGIRGKDLIKASVRNAKKALKHVDAGCSDDCGSPTEAVSGSLHVASPTSY